VLPEMRRDKVYTLIKTNVQSITTSTTVDTSAAFSWSLTTNGLVSADSTAVVTLFDQWRIVGVEFTIFANNNSNAGPIISVIDYDDATLLGSQSAAGAYDTNMITQGGQVHTRQLCPRAANAVYSGTVFTNFGQEKSGKWLDTASASTPHYGIKYYIPATGVAQVLTTSSRIWYQFKNVR